MPGLGVESAEAEVPGDTEVPGEAEVSGEAVRPVEDADGVGLTVRVRAGVADGVGWVGELGASCAQAAITTRLLAGSALPPTPLRSTK